MARGEAPSKSEPSAPGVTLEPEDAAIAAASLVVAVFLAALLGGGWLESVGLGCVFAVGAYLWLNDQPRRWGDLGQGIVVSVLVALAFLAIQRHADERNRAVDADRERNDKLQSLRLTLGLQSNLSGIDLRERDLRGFVLTDKRLRGARLDGARLEEAVLSGSDLRGISAPDTVFDNAALAGADLRRARVIRKTYDVTGLDSVAQNRTERILGRASFRGAVLDRANLTGLDLRGVDLSRASLDGARLAGADLSRANLRDARLRGTDLTGANLTEATLHGADLRASTLCGSTLAGTELEGTRFSASTRWPKGFDPPSAGAEQLDFSPKSTEGTPLPEPHYAHC